MEGAFRDFSLLVFSAMITSVSLLNLKIFITYQLFQIMPWKRQKYVISSRKKKRTRLDQVSSDTSSESLSDLETTAQSSTFRPTPSPLRASSPVPFDEMDSLNDENSTESSDSECTRSSDSDELYHGSDLSVKKFEEKLIALQTKHRMPDAALKDVVNLFASVLPLPNKCPTYYRFKESVKCDDEPVKLTLDGGVCYFLPFKSIVQNILLRYPDAMTNVEQKKNVLNDITDGSFFPKVENNTLYFVINTDGISPLQSRKVQVWPVILSLINLKPKFRKMVSNLIMISLYVGEYKPSWAEILPYINTQLNSGLDIAGKHYKCKVVCLVADMPAKSSICNLQNAWAK